MELEGISGSITLDSELQEAYSGTTSMNSAMSGEFPHPQARHERNKLDGRGDEGRSEAKLEVSGMICVYTPDCTDFSGNGLGPVSPLSCTVTETLNGEWN